MAPVISIDQHKMQLGQLFKEANQIIGLFGLHAESYTASKRAAYDL